MTELTKINPGPVKVTVARPLGRAASHGGGRAVEAVPPVVLDNETALGFLREKAREGGYGRNRSSLEDDPQLAGKRSPQGDRRALRDGLERIEFHDSGRPRSSRFQRPSLEHAAPSAGFATHLMAQGDEITSGDPEFAQRQRENRHSQSSEAYRRAGAEPLLYGQASQVISVAI